MVEKRMTEEALVSDMEFAMENIEEAIHSFSLASPQSSKEALARALDYIQDVLDVL